MEVLAAADVFHAAWGLALRLEPRVPRDGRGVRRSGGGHPFVRVRPGSRCDRRGGVGAHDRRIPDGLVPASGGRGDDTFWMGLDPGTASFAVATAGRHSAGATPPRPL